MIGTNGIKAPAPVEVAVAPLQTCWTAALNSVKLPSYHVQIAPIMHYVYVIYLR